MLIIEDKKGTFEDNLQQLKTVLNGVAIMQD